MGVKVREKVKAFERALMESMSPPFDIRNAAIDSLKEINQKRNEEKISEEEALKELERIVVGALVIARMTKSDDQVSRSLSDEVKKIAYEYKDINWQQTREYETDSFKAKMKEIGYHFLGKLPSNTDLGVSDTPIGNHLDSLRELGIETKRKIEKELSDVHDGSRFATKEEAMQNLQTELRNSKSIKDLITLFEKVKSQHGEYSVIHQQRHSEWDSFRLKFKKQPKNFDEDKFWHTKTYQAAIGLIKEKFLELKKKNPKDSAEGEDHLIDYVRGNAPAHRSETSLRHAINDLHASSSHEQNTSADEKPPERRP